tara:strand:- start:1927 stop:2469 length:543 start_codon:yes stop_codon:yes gene_type:complete
MEAKYTQVVINKSELLKHIIKEHLKKDVNEVSRERLLVEARFIYFYILRNNEQMVYQKIADTVNMNHATVLHGYDKVKFWLKTDHKFRDKYLIVLARYNREVYGIEKEKEINKLRDKLNKEREDKTKPTKIEIRAKKTGTIYEKLHTLIDKTPEEKADDLLIRVEAIFNMMQMDLKRKQL